MRLLTFFVLFAFFLVNTETAMFWGKDTWHHCYNRTVGTRADRPFGDAEKEMFVRMLKRLAAFYTVRVVSCTFMSNHYNSHQTRTKRSTVA